MKGTSVAAGGAFPNYLPDLSPPWSGPPVAAATRHSEAAAAASRDGRGDGSSPASYSSSGDNTGAPTRNPASPGMLSERLVVATRRDASTNTTAAADAPAIAIHVLHGSAVPLATFKRSNTAAHGLAVTATHLFAAQSDKAVINVYSRATNALESTVPFPERFTVIEASPGGEFIACGTESGRILVWEIASARFVSTPTTHLQGVTCLAFSRGGTHLLSGSADSNVLVWSLPALLDVRGAPASPAHTLDRHQAAVTAVAAGRAGAAGGPSDVCASASRDRSVLLWDYHTGAHLRTFLLERVPTALAVDPADRAVYAGLDDGGVQCIELLGSAGAGEAAHPLFVDALRDAPVALTGARWPALAGQTEVTALAVAYEGNYLITGDAGGDVCVRDVASGQLFKTLTSLKAPITVLKLEPPSGFITPTDSSSATELSSSSNINPSSSSSSNINSNTAISITNTPNPTSTFNMTTPITSITPPSTTSLPTVPKPRYDAILAATSTTTYTAGTYSLTAAFDGILPTSAFAPPFSPPRATFGPDADMAAVLKGVADLARANGAGVAARDQVLLLERENERLRAAYDQLSGLHKRLWEVAAGGMMGADGNGTAE